MPESELDDLFGDVDNFDDDINRAAQKIANMSRTQEPTASMPTTSSPPPQEMMPKGPQVIEQIQTVAPPPSAPVLSVEEKEMSKYNQEKKKLFEIREQIFKLAHSDTSGTIIRNFDLSQIVLKVGEEVDRLNGLVVFRALKARCKSVSLLKDTNGSKKNTEVTEKEEIANCMYEVWGVMEDGGVGLTSSYAPEMVLCVISLKSGYDLPPA
jgi:hypothetical protein